MLKFLNTKTINKGFTLVEILVAVSIVIFLTTIVLSGWGSGVRHFALQRAANKLAQDIRRAQEMAISSKECSPLPSSCPAGGGVPAGGYGFYINKTEGFNGQYMIYADDGSEKYDVNEEIETISLEEEVYIKEFNPGANFFSINFKPPDPEINIKDNNENLHDDLRITVALRSDPVKTKTIVVNKVGLIYVE